MSENFPGGPLEKENQKEDNQQNKSLEKNKKKCH